MYDFDEIIDRRNTNALSVEGFRGYIFHADETMEFPFKDDEFIRMWVADMDFAVPDVILDAVRERLDRRILGYTDIYGPEYYEAFSAWCRKQYGWDFAKEELVTSSGVVPAICDLAGYITKEDENVLFLTPSYGPFNTAAKINGRRAVCSDLVRRDGRFEIDFADLEAKCAEEKTTLFIFCNPHNPTGRVWTEEELERVAELIRKYDLWVISDEIHCDLLRTGLTHIPLGKVMPGYEKLVTCMAPTKTFNIAGLAISNILIRSEKIRRIWKMNNMLMENPLSLAAAQAAYEKGADWLRELKLYLDENFRYAEEFFKEMLPEAVFSEREATYLAWVDLGAYFGPQEDLPLFFANNAGVILEGADSFVRNGTGFVRLNLAIPHSVLEEGLQRIAAAVKNR